MNSLNGELRRANDIKGWKVLGRYEATASRWREGQPCFASAHLQVHQLSGSAILEKLHNVNVCQINNQKTPKHLKGTLKALMFCSGSDETCLLIVKRDYGERGCEFLRSLGWTNAALPFHLQHLLKALRQGTAVALREEQGEDPDQHSQASHQDIW